MAAVHASHPLGQRSGVNLSEPGRSPVILVSRILARPILPVRSVVYFPSMDWNPKNVREVRELQLALGFVAAGEGICLVPESAKKH